MQAIENHMVIGDYYVEKFSEWEIDAALEDEAGEEYARLLRGDNNAIGRFVDATDPFEFTKRVFLAWGNDNTQLSNAVLSAIDDYLECYKSWEETVDTVVQGMRR